MTISAPGIYAIAAADYHADPCPEPSLSSSVARDLLGASPRHAWYAHPRLNPEYQPEEDQKFDLGAAAHAHLLEGDSGSGFVIVEAPDWRTKAAQEARAQARLAGRIPLLSEQWTRVQMMAEAARRQLADHQDAPQPLARGTPEQTIIWREDDVWLRARLDWLHDGQRVVDDYKWTEASANPEAWIRGPLWNMGYDVQAAFYLRGLRAVAGLEAVFRFVVQESYAPYALSVIGLGPEALTLAEKKVAWAIAAWRHCLTRRHWPGYPVQTCWAEPPAWELARWEEHQTMDALDDGRPLAAQLMGEP